MLTGTHWPSVDDLPTLKRIGYDFAIMDFPPDNPGGWRAALELAERLDLKLVAGLYPPPYHRNRDGSWTISAAGLGFLNDLRAHSRSVMAIFVFDEPYYLDPHPGGKQYDCGFYSASDLRSLRSKIRSVWPEAKIYIDFDDPTEWAPGGHWWEEKKSCIGEKFKDQTGIADYAGIWSFPFETKKGYAKEEGLKDLRHQIDFVNSSMSPAKPVLDAQAFASVRDGVFFPSPAQMLDWNCALRRMGATAMSWYPWQQEGRYEDYLSKHPENWPVTVRTDCSAA